MRPWEDLWRAFEFLRLLAARPEEWEARFTTGIPGLLAPGERLALPGEAERAVWVSADATLETYGAIDWTARLCARQQVQADFRAFTEASQSETHLIIALAELLAIVAFAAARCQDWAGKLVICITDNANVEAWLRRRAPRPKLARQLLRFFAVPAGPLGLRNLGCIRPDIP